MFFFPCQAAGCLRASGQYLWPHRRKACLQIESEGKAEEGVGKGVPKLPGSRFASESVSGDEKISVSFCHFFPDLQRGPREAGAKTTPSLRQATAQSHHGTIFYQLQANLPMSPRLPLQQPPTLTPACLPFPQTWWGLCSVSPVFLSFPLPCPPDAETPLASPEAASQLPVAGTKTAAGSSTSASLAQLPVAVPVSSQLIPFISPVRRGQRR